jgi:hypothetical protein
MGLLWNRTNSDNGGRKLVMVLTTAKSDGMKAFVLEEGKEMNLMEGTGDYIILQRKREQLGLIQYLRFSIVRHCC